MTRVLRAKLPGLGLRAGRLAGDIVEVLDHDDALAALRGEGRVECSVPLAGLELLPPVVAPEIWCAGVTYERSRDARLEEAQTDARDVYALVYDAERPELFLKDAQMRRTVGPNGQIRLRGDSTWLVPEPELGLVLGDAGEPVAVTIGNDVSSRDIEGENPLYIPQAKIFAGACAIGPVLAVPEDWDAPFVIRLRITSSDGAELFAGETSTARMKRSPRGAGRLADARQSGTARLGPADRHRTRPARRLHPQVRSHRRDRDPGNRRSRQHGRLTWFTYANQVRT